LKRIQTILLGLVHGTVRPIAGSLLVTGALFCLGLISVHAGLASYSVETVGAVPGPWAFQDGVWVSEGSGAGCGGPYHDFLSSPNYVVTADGEVSLSVDHRHAFEADMVDAGQLWIRVNGGAYTDVGKDAFSANGYTDKAIVGNGIAKGQNGFGGTSAGYADGSYITTTASLGSFSAGDVISVRFVALYDDCATGTNPNWVVASVSSDQMVLDTTAPVITLSENSTVTHEANTTYTDAGATATDGVDGSVTVSTSGTVDVNTLGAYTLTYSASDAAGNAATSVTRTVTVEDTTPPIITSLTPKSGAIGSEVTITGTNFNPNASGNIVYFGGVIATVTSASSSQLIVNNPPNTTYGPISVTVNGLTGYYDLPYNSTFPNSGTIVSASFSSRAGFGIGNTNPAIGGVNQIGLADVNSDGKLDVIASASSGISVFQNKIDQTINSSSFADQIDLGIEGDGLNGLAIGDLDGDGKIDLVCHVDGKISVFRNNHSSGDITASSFDTRVDFDTFDRGGDW
jgi:hypothetical protein